MTRFDIIKNSTVEQIARLLCDNVVWGMQAKDSEEYDRLCEMCVASSKCKYGYNGFIDWLGEDVDVGEDNEK